MDALFQLNSVGWLETLCILYLGQNEYTSLSFLDYLQERLDVINLRRFRSLSFSSFRECTKGIQFPKYLTKLNIEKCNIIPSVSESASLGIQ